MITNTTTKSTDFTGPEECAFQNDSIPGSGSITIKCKKPIIGKYVWIQKNCFYPEEHKSNRSSFIALCEVVVTGCKIGWYATVQ